MCIRDSYQCVGLGASEESDEGIVADHRQPADPITGAIEETPQKAKMINMHLECSLQLTRSLTALTYFDKECNLISGSLGMVNI